MAGISFEAHLGENQTVPGLAGEAVTAELIKKAAPPLNGVPEGQ